MEIAYMVDDEKVSPNVEAYVEAFEFCTLSQLLKCLARCEDVKEYAKRKGDNELYYEYNDACIAIMINMKKFC